MAVPAEKRPLGFALTLRPPCTNSTSIQLYADSSDANTDTMVKAVPLLYRGPGCTTALTGTDEETANPGHILVTNDKKTLYVGTAGGFGLAAARVRQEPTRTR